jgi:hypothetical protein
MTGQTHAFNPTNLTAQSWWFNCFFIHVVSIVGDMRVFLRILCKRPGFTLVALIALGLSTGFSTVILHAAGGLTSGITESRSLLDIAIMALAVLLLVACTHAAGGFLADETSRRKEMALRAVMGASPSRQFRQVLLESSVLSGMGGAMGLLVSKLIAGSIDVPGLMLASLVCAGANLSFRMVPALDGSEIFRTPLRRSRAALPFAEVGLSLALLVAAVTMLPGFGGPPAHGNANPTAAASSDAMQMPALGKQIPD